MWTTRHGRLLGPTATVIQIDHDPDAIGAHHRVDVAVRRRRGRGRAGALLAELEPPRVPGSAGGRRELAERIAARRLAATRRTTTPATATQIDPRTLSAALDELLPAERTVAIDSGHFMGYPAMYLRVPDERGFVLHPGVSGGRPGAGSAIGAAVARPGSADRRRARRRRRDDGAARAGDGRAARAARC